MDRIPGPHGRGIVDSLTIPIDDPDRDRVAFGDAFRAKQER